MQARRKPACVRTRTGCWTCRARRKKCDETRPSCTNCSTSSLHCEGYSFRLKWAASRKCFAGPLARLGRNDAESRPRPNSSRRRVRGAPKPSNEPPLLDFSPSVDAALGPATEDKALRAIQYLGKPVFDTLNEFERDVMYDFIGFGSNTLHTDFETDDGFCKHVLPLCAGSKSLLANCLTYQLSLSLKHAAQFDVYYVKSLELFRREMRDSISTWNEGTYLAGILLSSISMNQALPWTFHLVGMGSLLESRYSFEQPDPDAAASIALLGSLDLPVFAIARQTPSLQVWYKHCRFQPGINDVLDLPCSLVDLLSSIEEPGIEQRFLTWPGEAGELQQQRFWDIVRHAGIISAREHRKGRHVGGEVAGNYMTADSPSTESVVLTTLSLMRAFRRELRDDDVPSWGLPLYPFVVVGSQHEMLQPPDKEFIRQCIVDIAENEQESRPYYKAALTVLEELWYNGRGRSIEQVAQDMSLELALF